MLNAKEQTDKSLILLKQFVGHVTTWYAKTFEGNIWEQVPSMAERENQIHLQNTNVGDSIINNQTPGQQIFFGSNAIANYNTVTIGGIPQQTPIYWSEGTVSGSVSLGWEENPNSWENSDRYVVNYLGAYGVDPTALATGITQPVTTSDYLETTALPVIKLTTRTSLYPDGVSTRYTGFDTDGAGTIYNLFTLKYEMSYPPVKFPFVLNMYTPITKAPSKPPGSTIQPEQNQIQVPSGYTDHIYWMPRHSFDAENFSSIPDGNVFLCPFTVYIEEADADTASARIARIIKDDGNYSYNPYFFESLENLYNGSLDSHTPPEGGWPTVDGGNVNFASILNKDFVNPVTKDGTYIKQSCRDLTTSSSSRANSDNNASLTNNFGGILVNDQDNQKCDIVNVQVQYQQHYQNSNPYIVTVHIYPKDTILNVEDRLIFLDADKDLTNQYFNVMKNNSFPITKIIPGGSINEINLGVGDDLDSTVTGEYRATLQGTSSSTSATIRFKIYEGSVDASSIYIESGGSGFTSSLPEKTSLDANSISVDIAAILVTNSQQNIDTIANGIKHNSYISDVSPIHTSEGKQINVSVRDSQLIISRMNDSTKTFTVSELTVGNYWTTLTYVGGDDLKNGSTIQLPSITHDYYLELSEKQYVISDVRSDAKTFKIRHEWSTTIINEIEIGNILANNVKIMELNKSDDFENSGSRSNIDAVGELYYEIVNVITFSATQIRVTFKTEHKFTIGDKITFTGFTYTTGETVSGAPAGDLRKLHVDEFSVIASVEGYEDPKSIFVDIGDTLDRRPIDKSIVSEYPRATRRGRKNWMILRESSESLMSSINMGNYENPIWKIWPKHYKYFDSSYPAESLRKPPAAVGTEPRNIWWPGNTNSKGLYYWAPNVEIKEEEMNVLLPLCIQSKRVSWLQAEPTQPSSLYITMDYTPTNKSSVQSQVDSIAVGNIIYEKVGTDIRKVGVITSIHESVVDLGFCFKLLVILDNNPVIQASGDAELFICGIHIKFNSIKLSRNPIDHPEWFEKLNGTDGTRGYKSKGGWYSLWASNNTPYRTWNSTTPDLSTPANNFLLDAAITGTFKPVDSIVSKTTQSGTHINIEQPFWKWFSPHNTFGANSNVDPNNRYFNSAIEPAQQSDNYQYIDDYNMARLYQYQLGQSLPASAQAVSNYLANQGTGEAFASAYNWQQYGTGGLQYLTGNWYDAASQQLGTQIWYDGDEDVWTGELS